MAHRFSIKEVAGQAGLSTATVDRVLHGRAHVSARSQARVRAALAELERQAQAARGRGRQLWVDVIVEAPDRFSRTVRSAAEVAARQIGPARLRPRFHLQEVMDEAEITARLRRIGRRGSDGICLKARDVPAIRQAVAALVAQGIPVVTLVTDISGRTAYAGLDNAQAGRTAAALIARQVTGARVMVSASRDDFAGEALRLEAFRAALPPDLRITALPAGAGQNTATGQEAARVLREVADVEAVYSVGGGNRAIVAALSEAGITPAVYVAHDLDHDNRALLRAGRLDFVLYHDLAADMATAFGHVLAAHRLADPPEVPEAGSDVQIVLRENMPRALGD